MKSFFKRFISQFLVLCLIGLPFTARAGMIGTDDVIAQAQVQSDREKVRSFMARADVQQQFMQQGVDAQFAKDRVGALTDQEISQIAGKIDALPAGANAVEVVALVALLIILIYIILQYAYPKAK
jgi:hypothetical protein